MSKNDERTEIQREADRQDEERLIQAVKKSFGLPSDFEGEPLEHPVLKAFAQALDDEMSKYDGSDR